MPSVPDRTPAEPVPASPNLIALPRPPKVHRPAWVKWVVGTALVALVATSGLLWRAHLQNVVQYETVPVERGPVQANVTATGTLNAVVDVLVSSQVSGNIKALYADWNTKVKAGQLVALIDPEIFQAQVDQATATVRSATAARITAEAQLEKAKSDLSGAIATEKSAQANLTKDQANAANTKALRRKSGYARISWPRHKRWNVRQRPHSGSRKSTSTIPASWRQSMEPSSRGAWMWGKP